MTTELNVLLSSAGRRVALLDIFRRTLSEMDLEGRVMAADMSPLSSAWHSADDAFLVPRCTDKEFVPAMLDLCKNHNVGLLVPTLDPELPVYARHRDAFARIGTTVAISSPEVIAIASDKNETHAWLTEERLPTVRQTTDTGFADNGQKWKFPVLVKPRNGSSSIGVAVVDDYLQFEAATRGGDFIVQGIAPGHEYTLDVLADRSGNCVCAVPRRRIETRAGEVSKGVTVRSGELIELAGQVCERLPGAFGPLNIQMFFDIESQEINVIEINPRFAGGFPLSWQAGAKYPQWLIEEILGRPSSANPSTWTDGLVMLRWDQAVFTTAEQAGL
ncbi:MAG: ATP-grasp domain-containing protein [Actinomycetota bacterium]